MYRVFPFKLETYMKKSFKIFSPRFLCPCLKPAPFSLTQCYTKQALRTRSCVLRIFIKNIELLFAAKTIKTKIQLHNVY